MGKIIHYLALILWILSLVRLVVMPEAVPSQKWALPYWGYMMLAVLGLTIWMNT